MHVWSPPYTYTVVAFSDALLVHFPNYDYVSTYAMNLSDIYVSLFDCSAHCALFFVNMVLSTHPTSSPLLDFPLITLPRVFFDLYVFKLLCPCLDRFNRYDMPM